MHVEDERLILQRNELCRGCVHFSPNGDVACPLIGAFIAGVITSSRGFLIQNCGLYQQRPINKSKIASRRITPE